MTDDNLIESVRKVSLEYQADIYLYSGSIDHDGFGKLISCYSPNKQPNALLILTTHGGLANSAFKISRFFQTQYKKFSIFIPSVCKSAGTLVALGANDLVMSTFSELGPLDVQLYERDEIGARKSGLLSHSAFEALKSETFELYEHFMLSIKARSGDNISFSVASDVAGDMASRVMAPIFEQISPTILGGDYRDLQVAVEYGNRLSAFSGNISFDNVRFLTEKYPSHDFIIDIQEAAELFNRVLEPSLELWALISHIRSIVFSPQEPTIVSNLTELSTGQEDDEGDEKINGIWDIANVDDSPASNSEGHNRESDEGEAVTENG